MASSVSGMSVRLRQAVNRKRCPECGAQMSEVDRHNENGVLFLWYECSRDSCDGQWLEKMAYGSMNNLVSKVKYRSS